MTGSFAADFEKAFLLAFGQVSHTYLGKSAHHEQDVVHLIEEFLKDGLFEYCPPRQHRAFPGYVRSDSLKNPLKLGRHIKELDRHMDFWHRRAERARARQDNQQ